MRTFGRSHAKGRRSVPRIEMPLMAKLSKGAVHQSAELMDLSRTGARLRGATFPADGSDLEFRAEKVRATGEVVWVEGEECGVAFDTPIAGAEVNRIRTLANFVKSVAE